MGIYKLSNIDESQSTDDKHSEGTETTKNFELELEIELEIRFETN
jgi:hypothetical protein